MIHNGPLSEHPYNTCSIAGLWQDTDCWGDPRLRWVRCEYPVLGILKETEKAKLIKLSESLAVWIPKRVIHRISNNILYWTPLSGYHFGGPNDEFFVKL